MKLKTLSIKRLPSINVLLPLLLILLLTSCASSPPQLVMVSRPPIPPNLLQPCEIPILSKNATNADIAQYAAQLIINLKNCNVDKKAIGEILSK